MTCQYCKGPCKKEGFQKNGAQKYRCKACGKYQQEEYRYNACRAGSARMVARLTCNGCGISDIARALEISATTVMGKIRAVSGTVRLPADEQKSRSYEVDEMRTISGSKKNEVWIVYALGRCKGDIPFFSLGTRS